MCSLRVHAELVERLDRAIRVELSLVNLTGRLLADQRRKYLAPGLFKICRLYMGGKGHWRLGLGRLRDEVLFRGLLLHLNFFNC